MVRVERVERVAFLTGMMMRSGSAGAGEAKQTEFGCASVLACKRACKSAINGRRGDEEGKTSSDGSIVTVRSRHAG